MVVSQVFLKLLNNRIKEVSEFEFVCVCVFIICSCVFHSYHVYGVFEIDTVTKINIVEIRDYIILYYINQTLLSLLVVAVV